MRFLFITQYFPPEVGAPQARLASLVHELLRDGHEVEIVTAMPNYPNGSIFSDYRGRFYRRERWEDVIVHRTWLYACVGAGPKRILNYLSFTLTSLLGILRSRKADCVFVESPPLFLTIPGFLISRLWKAVFVFNVADLWPDSVQQLGLMDDGIMLRVARALESWSYRKADYVNAVTHRMKQILLNEKGLAAEKLLFLPNGVDTEVFRDRPPDIELVRSLGLEGKNVVLYAGNHGYIAGLETALQAAKLVENLPNIHFLFVGGGSEKARLTRLARELDLKNTTFLDPVPLSELPRFMSIASCCLVTLRDCPLSEIARPAKTFVMMASGKPIVLSAAGESTQIVRDAEGGIVVPPGNPEAVAKAIIELDRNPALARALGANGRKYVERNFRWQDLIRSWLAQLQAGQQQKSGRTAFVSQGPLATAQDSAPQANWDRPNRARQKTARASSSQFSSPR
jgi:colanic acid biosynthesis glycosyl transferase WcaI